nr:DUF3265 domain-containing protein [Vibrio litoralis]
MTRPAWHFYYALHIVIKVLCRNFGIVLSIPTLCSGTQQS